MTGFAQVKGQVNQKLAFTLSLKSVNHRFLDLHFRLPSETDALEMKLRRMLKEKIHRGHLEVSLSLDRNTEQSMALNRELVSGYISAFRAAAAEYSLAAVPDLNVILRLPGALESANSSADGDLESAVLAVVDGALAELNRMREEEGRGIEQELRSRMHHIEKAASGVGGHRQAILHAYLEKLRSRMQELLGAQVDSDRLLQEAALLVDRSDIQEELVRLETHVKHFLGLLDEGGEVGKKLDFLLQEMNREVNTMGSKADGLRVSELIIAAKAELEKMREQVQNVE